jgi:DNA-binding PadR family transcriptional regulator
MPVKHGLLALLAEAPAHGYQLKADFEARTGGSWELNIGQVYTTLQRLERDGLVEADEAEADRIAYRITAAGREALSTWYGTPIVPVPPPRDELAIKVMFAIASPGVDHAAVLQRQRNAIITHLQALTRRKARLDPDADLPELLHLDAQLLRSEAEVRWLDTCEARLRHRAPRASDDAATPPRASPGEPEPPSRSEPPQQPARWTAQQRTRGGHA